MAYEANLDQLCDEAAEYLDIDHRFAMEDCGSFEWWGRRVYFEKTTETIILTVDGETLECGRP